MWLEGFQLALNSTNVPWLLLGSFVGLIVGVLPGLGPTFGVALMLPFTFSLDPATALIFLCAIHAACNYGDSFSSMMLNVPGGPGTVATCWDGYPMAKKGQAGRALGIATLSSFIGGLGAWVTLALLARPITDFAINLGAPEYFARLSVAVIAAVGADGIIEDAAIALGAAAPHPYRARQTEAVLIGNRWTPEVRASAIQSFSDEVVRCLGSRPSAPYKREAIKGVAWEALKRCLGPCGPS